MHTALRTILSSAKGATVAPWAPTDLGASLYDMWDAEDATRLTLSGAAVTAWAVVAQAAGGGVPASL